MITVKADSAGGHGCLVFYNDGKPFYTWWDVPGAPLKGLELQIEALDIKELEGLMVTLKALKLEHGRIRSAVEAYLVSINQKET